jgi:hypothetical protein
MSTELVNEPKKWLQPFCMTKLFGVLYRQQALQKELSIVKGPVNYKLYKDYTIPLFQKHTCSCPELLNFLGKNFFKFLSLSWSFLITFFEVPNINIREKLKQRGLN